ncbi:MAG: flavin reductase family protein [Planctomycetaceae bacterium]
MTEQQSTATATSGKGAVSALAAVLGKTPSGLFILTANGPDGMATGMLASWVQQCSFEPPMMTVVVNRKRYLNDWLSEGAIVGLNLLGETQKSLLGHFGKGFDPGTPAFEGLRTDQSPQGATVLVDALGWLEGRVVTSVLTGDHVTYVVELVAGKPSTELETQRPYVHLRKNGLGY